MRKHHSSSRAGAVVAAALLLPALSGCSPLGLVDLLAGSSPRSGLESPAEVHNSVFQQELDLMLDHLWVGEWRLPTGGNVRTACDAGAGAPAYLFYGSWISPEEAGFPGDRETAQRGIAGLRDWLAAAGWEELEEFEFKAGVVPANAFGVAGSKPGLGEMQAIYYYEGEPDLDYPHLVLDLDSACLVADLPPDAG